MPQARHAKPVLTSTVETAVQCNAANYITPLTQYSEPDYPASATQHTTISNMRNTAHYTTLCQVLCKTNYINNYPVFLALENGCSVAFDRIAQYGKRAGSRRCLDGTVYAAQQKACAPFLALLNCIVHPLPNGTSNSFKCAAGGWQWTQ